MRKRRTSYYWNDLSWDRIVRGPEPSSAPILVGCFVLVAIYQFYYIDYGPRPGQRSDLMAAHLEKAAIVEAVFANEDRLHRRLHIIVDAAPAGALEEGEMPDRARRTPSPASRVDRHARTACGCGRAGHGRF